MHIKLLFVGKTGENYLEEGIEKYMQRLRHYGQVERIELPSPKMSGKKDARSVKEAEGLLLMKHIGSGDHVVLLDEKGKSLTSVEFARQLQKKMNAGLRTLIFIVGGPFGFSDALYDRADEKLALSDMTFSHEMVRLFFAEQLYRAFTILKGEKYHHD